MHPITIEVYAYQPLVPNENSVPSGVGYKCGAWGAGSSTKWFKTKNEIRYPGAGFYLAEPHDAIRYFGIFHQNAYH